MLATNRRAPKEAFQASITMNISMDHLHYESRGDGDSPWDEPISDKKDAYAFTEGCILMTDTQSPSRPNGRVSKLTSMPAISSLNGFSSDKIKKGSKTIEIDVLERFKFCGISKRHMDYIYNINRRKGGVPIPGGIASRIGGTLSMPNNGWDKFQYLDDAIVGAPYIKNTNKHVNRMYSNNKIPTNKASFVLRNAKNMLKEVEKKYEQGEFGKVGTDEAVSILRRYRVYIANNKLGKICYPCNPGEDAVIMVTNV